MEPDAVAIAGSLPLGTVGEVEVVVGDHNLAEGRGVFSTPKMVELMERAANHALDRFFPPGWTSVGTEICVRHLAATPPGATVRARAELVGVQGRRLQFKVEAHNTTRKIGEGTHERALVNLAAFVGEATRNRQETTGQ